MSKALLFDARLVLEKPTGIGQYITSLLPQMISMAPDWLFHILRRPAPWSSYGLSEIQGSNVIQHVSSVPHMSLRQHLAIPLMARRLDVDLLHYPHFDAPVVFSPVPVVVIIHDVKYLKYPDYFPELSRLKRYYMQFAIKQSLTRASSLIADSDNTAMDIYDLFGDQEKRLSIIHLAADNAFQPISDYKQHDVCRKFDLSRPFILNVGERRPHKNHVGLIEAYAICESRNTHDLVIIGQPYGSYDKPQKVAISLGLSEQIHFLDKVSLEELVALYNAAELFVLVSFYEGFGLPILEAMACETPVIASNTTATGEITGRGGLQVDPSNNTKIANSIDRVIGDPELRNNLIERGKKRASEFSWERAAKETLEVYERVLSSQ